MSKSLVTTAKQSRINPSVSFSRANFKTWIVNSWIGKNIDRLIAPIGIALITGGFLFIWNMNSNMAVLKEKDATNDKTLDQINKKLDDINEGVQKVDRRLIVVETKVDERR